MSSRWRPGDQPDLEAIEAEAVAEREAIQEESCTEYELSRLAAIAASGGTKRGKQYSVPNTNRRQKCSRCEGFIVWRRYGAKSIPLDTRTIIEDSFGQAFALDHRVLCGKSFGEVG